MDPSSTHENGDVEQNDPNCNAPNPTETIQSSPTKPEVRNPIPAIVNEQAKQAAVAEDASSKKHDVSDAALADRIKKSDRLMIALTAIITAASVWQAYIVSQGGEQTSRMVEAAEGMREALASSVVQNKENFATNLAETKAALRATLDQGQKALDASIAASQLDHRAWVSVHAGVATDASITDDAFEIKVRMKNVGTTPALKVLPKVFTRALGPTKDTIDGELKETPVAADIGPGIETSKSIRPDFSLPINVAIKSGGIKLYVFGTVHYDDAFGVHHTTEFCVLYNPKLNRTEFCSDFNRMD